MQLAQLVETSHQIAEASGRLEKVTLLAGLLRRSVPQEIEIATAFLRGSPRQAKLGVGFASVRAAAPGAAAASPTLTLTEVDATLERLARVTGKGGSEQKRRLMRELLGRATTDEQLFLVTLIAGALRQGALDGLVTEAVAQAAGAPAETVRHAVMATGDLPGVARVALVDGVPALAGISIQVFRPILPMLAESADGVFDALARLGRAALEYKLDGARVQLHKRGDEVQVYTRGLNQVTAAVPELVEITRALPAHELILDGEAVALQPNGRPYPFQTTMRRFGRKLAVERLRRELPLTVFFFDILHLNGAPLLQERYDRRVAALAEIAPTALLPRTVTASVDEAQAFLRAALAQGHEGIMAKALDAAYEAGSRGQHWLKVKPVRTLDLVVLAAEWGHGRRHGWLSNLHLGARDPDEGGFVMLGKTFKGMTDQMLAWQTQYLLQREIGRDASTVRVRPDLVLEIAFNDVQASPRYPGGVALRFARVKRYRTDKTPEQADVIAAVRELLPRSTKTTPTPG
jgi:DNA ligase-1